MFCKIIHLTLRQFLLHQNQLSNKAFISDNFNQLKYLQA